MVWRAHAPSPGRNPFPSSAKVRLLAAFAGERVRAGKSASVAERGRRTWRVPVHGGVVSDNSSLNASLAEQGLGLASRARRSAPLRLFVEAAKELAVRAVR